MPEAPNRRTVPWGALPWGKVAGVLIGIPAGVFGMIFGLIVGHLIDELVWAFLMRRLLRRFFRTGYLAPELESTATAAAILVVLTDEMSCSADRPQGVPASVRGYLKDKFAVRIRSRRSLDLAFEEAAAAERQSVSTAAREEACRILEERLVQNERAEVVWLAGRVARDVGPCARRTAEQIAERLGVPARIVTEGARPAGTLDERACMLLGVSEHADREEVRRAYRRLAAQFHPDGASVLEEHQRRKANEAFIRIQSAYEQLMRELGEEP
jgi:DnaJ-domain-containing protein 1